MQVAAARYCAATMLLSAGLLFMVQPMVGRLVLPQFGGTPAVWNTCMVFFQALLLAGYAYVHWSLKHLGLRWQARVHVVVLLAPLLVLPLTLGSDTAPDPSSSWLGLRLIGRLLAGVGLPFFVLSSTAPLLQRWFAAADHAHSRDPYFLYAASNAGSLVALLGYPLLAEPLLELSAQNWWWSLGYVVLVMSLAPLAVAAATAEADRVEPAPQTGTAGAADGPSLRQRGLWIAAAFVPSSLMLGATLHITTNLAAIPLLWVLPLALYLLTFIIVFARHSALPGPVNRHGPMVLLALGALFSMSIRGAEWLLIPAHLLMFGVAALVCHGRLAASRPPAAQLTSFYLCMSIGGVLGGLFNSLVAPLLFTRVLEYPLAMAAACLFLPRSGAGGDGPRARRADLIRPLLLAAAAAAILWMTAPIRLSHPLLAFGAVLGPTAMVCFSFKERPLRFALGYVVLLAAVGWHADLERGRAELSTRNFFGVKRVTVDPQGDLRHLYHGTTVHGSQFIEPQQRGEPLTYYHRSGPAGDVFAQYVAGQPAARVGVIGLGAGALASYAQPGQRFTFFEIDPDVIAIARDARFFTYLSASAGANDVVLGDGRIALRQVRPGSFDLLVIDAFSSDAIPVHLITRQALDLYVSRLTAEGVLLFHVSNRYLDLEPLLGRLAGELGWACAARADIEVQTDSWERGRTAAHYVAMAAHAERLGPLLERPGWKRVPVDPRAPLWTDDYSNLLGLLKWE